MAKKEEAKHRMMGADHHHNDHHTTARGAARPRPANGRLLARCLAIASPYSACFSWPDFVFLFMASF